MLSTAFLEIGFRSQVRTDAVARPLTVLWHRQRTSRIYFISSFIVRSVARASA